MNNQFKNNNALKIASLIGIALAVIVTACSDGNTPTAAASTPSNVVQVFKINYTTGYRYVDHQYNNICYVTKEWGDTRTTISCVPIHVNP